MQTFSRLKNSLKADGFVILLLLVIGFGIYANSFHNKMFWDDDDFILKNQYIKDWKYIPRFFSENLIAGSMLLSNYWRPILLLVFSLEWHLWQSWAPGFHAVNTAFHALDGILLFFLLNRLFKNRTLSFLTCLIFIVHPLQTEAVVYVNSLGDSLSTFFIFSGMLLYFKVRDGGGQLTQETFYGGALLMYILALMSKETAFIMPAFLFLADFLQPSGLKAQERFKAVLKSLMPFLAVALAYVILRATILNFNNTFNFYKEANVFSSNLHVRVFTFFHTLSIYAGLLFRPLDLHVERSVPWATSFFAPPIIAGAAIFLAGLGLALATWNKRPVVSFGILWFFAGLAPSSNILIPINAVIYEHWLYLPLIGIFLAMIDTGIRLADKYRSQNILSVAFFVFVIFLSVLSINRNKDWRDPVLFYEQTLAWAPNSYRVINNLGMAYSDRGDQVKAEAAYKKAISLDASNPVAYHNLANTYRDTGRFALARDSYQTALHLDPQFLFSYIPLANLYLQEQDLAGARRILEQHYKYTPDKLTALETLAKIALVEKNWGAALTYMETASGLAPDNEKIKADIRQVKMLKESPDNPLLRQ